MHRFLIVIEKANENYSAYSPDLSGCVSAGKTRDEVARNMYEAVELHLKGLKEDGLPAPLRFQHSTSGLKPGTFLFLHPTLKHGLIFQKTKVLLLF